MASKNSTVKAVRGSIQVGDITINVYLLPDGSYRLAGRNVTDAIGEAANSLLRICSVKSLKDLPHADLSLLQVKSNTGESFVPVAIEDAVAYWAAMSNAGHKLATALLQALAIESIERRADVTFGRIVSEFERNERIKLRMQTIATRNELEDAIAWYCQTHEVSQNYAKFVYINATQALWIGTHGKIRKSVAECHGLTTGDDLRSALGDRPLQDIERVECLAARLIRDRGLEPVDAVEQAIDRIDCRGRYLIAN
jgi:hypothetical protein